MSIDNGMSIYSDALDAEREYQHHLDRAVDADVRHQPSMWPPDRELIESYERYQQARERWYAHCRITAVI